MIPLRWGILATGTIAGAMAKALGHVPDADLIAVASRRQDAAERFARHWGIPRAYGTAEAMLADRDIDVVYIASPNALHRDQVIAALRAGKHVLCEKPMTISAADTITCAQVARAEGRFLMEAMWTAFFPAMRKACDLIATGVIGTPRHLACQFVAPRDPGAFPNLFDPTLGGGATLDLGIYPVTVAQLLAGPIRSIATQMVIGPTGVDEMVAVVAAHENGGLSHLSFGFRADMPISARLTGDNGVIALPETFYKPPRVVHSPSGGAPDQIFDLPAIGNGYPHEVMEVHECLARGRLESEILPLDLSIRSARVLEEIRAQGGLISPA